MFTEILNTKKTVKELKIKFDYNVNDFEVVNAYRVEVFVDVDVVLQFGEYVLYVD